MIDFRCWRLARGELHRIGFIAILLPMPPAAQPWNDWYHCMASTRGTHLPDDPRGLRPRENDVQVEARYDKSPPRGIYALLYDRPKSPASRRAVYLPASLSAPVLDFVVQSLLDQKLDLIAGSLDDHHLHFLARVRSHDPRRQVMCATAFAAKQAVSASLLADLGLDHTDDLWSKSTRVVPIADRAHQISITKFILGQGRRGAATWSFAQRLPADSR